MNALEMLKDSTINGKIVEVQPFYRHTDQRNKETYQKCLIKNFPENYKDEDLKQIFSEFGTPISCRVVFDKNGKSKQIGFCRMLKHEEAVKAIEGLNGKKIENLEIVCCPALSSRKFAYESKSKEIVKLHSFIEKMKEIQKNLLNFLEDDEMSEKKDQKFIEFLNQHQIDDDKFKSFLLLILNISNNHNRNQFFFTKIFLILRIYKSKIKQLYSNNDILDLFKSNKQILLFLIQEQIIIFNESIACNLPRGERWICEYEDYFCPEVNKFNKDIDLPNDLNEFEEKRKIGENDAYICKLIRNDNITDFIIFINQNGIQLDLLIKSTFLETNSFLLKNDARLIEYSAFFGSFQIFNYLYLNGIKLTPSLWLYAVHGMNPEIICFLEEHKVDFPIKENIEEEEQNSISNLECIKESIKCHHNDIAKYILSLMMNDDQNEYDNAIAEYGFQYYNYEFISYALDNFSILDFAFKYDNLTILQFLLEDEGINIFVKKISNFKY